MQFKLPQPTQVTPPEPHAFFAVPAAQLPCPVQQPAHVVESQTQLPFTQCLPLVHALPVPQLQRPARQESANSGSHAVHAAPLAPHSAVVGEATQTPFAQQPLAQLTAEHPPEHEPPSQAAPPVHVMHAAPPVPQALRLVPI